MYLQEQALFGVAEWIARKWHVCAQRKGEAERVLARSSRTRKEVQDLWADQVEAQTVPLTNATANLAKLAVEHIISLTSYSKQMAKEIEGLDRSVASRSSDAVLEDADRREQLVIQKDKIDAEIRKRLSELGVTEKARLQRVLGNKYYQVCSICVFIVSPCQLIKFTGSDASPCSEESHF